MALDAADESTNVVSLAETTATLPPANPLAVAVDASDESTNVVSLAETTATLPPVVAVDVADENVASLAVDMKIVVPTDVIELAEVRETSGTSEVLD